MSDDLKKFLAILIVAPILLAIAAYRYGANQREETAAFQALPLEAKIRKQVDHVIQFREGQTTDGRAALQLTIQFQLFGLRSPLSELNHRAAGDLETIFKLGKHLQTADIQYNIQLQNAYGETSYSPAYYIEMDRTTYDRIQWQNFDPNNLPKITHIQTSL